VTDSDESPKILQDPLKVICTLRDQWGFMYGHVCETTGTPEVLPSRPLKGIMFKDCLNLKIDFASALIGPGDTGTPDEIVD